MKGGVKFSPLTPIDSFVLTSSNTDSLPRLWIRGIGVSGLSIEKLKFVLLCDFYGNLLTEKQQRFFKLHYEKDLSFGEIAQFFGVSRQAVHDSIKSSEAALQRYEKALGILSDFNRHRQIFTDILSHLQLLENGVDESKKIRTLHHIKKQIYTLMNPSEPEA